MDKTDPSFEYNKPVGYRVKSDVECCANCKFGGYLGYTSDPHRLCICELLGEPDDGSYLKISVDPLGICDAYKAYKLCEKRRLE